MPAAFLGAAGFVALGVFVGGAFLGAGLDAMPGVFRALGWVSNLTGGRYWSGCSGRGYTSIPAASAAQASAVRLSMG